MILLRNLIFETYFSEQRFPAVKTKSGKVYVGRIHADAVSKTEEDLDQIGWWEDGIFYTDEEARKKWGKASTDDLEPELHRAYRLNRQVPEIPDTPVNENVFYRGDNDSGKRIDEPFTVAKEIGAIFASENPANAKLYGPKITKFVAKTGTKILRYDQPEFWKLLGRRRPPNNWIGSVAKHGKEKLIDVVNLLTRIAHNRGYDAVVFSPTDDIGTMIFNPNAFEIQKSVPIEEKKLDLATKNDAAEYLIRQAWRFIPYGEDRYDATDVFLWIDNEEKLSNLAWKLSSQFYPDEPESWYNFKKDVEKVLHKLEIERLKRRQSKTPSLKDPLYLLKKSMVGKSWEQAKRQVGRLSVGAWGMRGSEKIPDEDAEELFNRIYKNAMGETVYEKDFLDQTGQGRLTDLEVKEETKDDDYRQYSINQFIRTYGGGGSKKITGKVRVWRGTNNPHAPIRPGDFVTFDRGYAQSYMRGKWKSIVTDILDAKDLLVYRIDIGMSELVYWPEGHQIKKYEGEIPTLRDFWEQHRFGI